MAKRENKKDVAAKFIIVLKKIQEELKQNNYTREELAESIAELSNLIATKYKVD
jgi:hypothetical protein